MKLIIEPTERLIDIIAPGGLGTVPGRIWQGKTDAGIEVAVVITRVSVDETSDLAEFERLLTPQPATMMAREAFPNRLVL